MGSRTTQILVIAAAVAGAVIAVGLAVVLLGDDASASRADYQATVVNTRDRVDFAYARIAKSQSVDELIERMDEASAVIGKTASDLDEAGVAEGFEDMNAQLVTKLQAFSSVLHARAAQRLLDDGGVERSDRLRVALATIDELTKSAQREMRRFIYEWGPEGIDDGLVPAFERHVAALGDDITVRVDVDGPSARLPLTRTVETQLYSIGREALANVVKHSHADVAHVKVIMVDHRVVLEVADNGSGFDPISNHAGHFGLDSMRSRADEIGADLRISSDRDGTVVRVEVPVHGD